ncbi:MAG: helix-turn-helix domain-containing protein [Pseudomonadota bacterium]|nr:helix-turn-helix domain-containing protein [Pseudomonadota bacterium]
MSPSASGSAAERVRELSVADYQLLAEFRHVLARFLAFSASAATEAGLAPRQHQALLAIKGAPGGAPMTVGDLAERLVIRHHSAVELVDRMVSSGYLRRRTDPGDRRRAILVLTANAERTLAGLSAAHRDELRRIAPLLSTLVTELGSAP